MTSIAARHNSVVIMLPNLLVTDQVTDFVQLLCRVIPPEIKVIDQTEHEIIVSCDSKELSYGSADSK